MSQRDIPFLLFAYRKGDVRRLTGVSVGELRRVVAQVHDEGEVRGAVPDFFLFARADVVLAHGVGVPRVVAQGQLDMLGGDFGFALEVGADPRVPGGTGGDGVCGRCIHGGCP